MPPAVSDIGDRQFLNTKLTLVPPSNVLPRLILDLHFKRFVRRKLEHFLGHVISRTRTFAEKLPALKTADTIYT
jgi:hypothetical protein